MVSFMSTSNRFISSSCHPIEHCPNFTSLPFLNHPRRLPLCVSFGFFPAKGKGCSSLMSVSSFRTPVLLYGDNSPSCLIRRCMSGDSDLEAEILDFMEKSDDPDFFPTKNDLINAGRVDLVEAIAKRGGWLKYGWDSEEDEETVQDDEFEGSILVTDKEVDNSSVLGDTTSLQQSLDDGGERSLVEGVQVGSSETELSHASPPYPGSASDESLQREAGVVGSGIEGILSGLEKYRSLKFGIGLRTKEGSSLDMRNEEEDDYQSKFLAKAVTGIEKSNGSAYLRAAEEFLADAQDMHIHSRCSSDGDGFGSSFKPEMWRKWSTHRAGFSNANFEAADIVPTNDIVHTKAKDANDTSHESEESVSSYKNNEPNDIRTRLQNLDEELSSALNLLRSRTDKLILHKGHGSSLEELQRLTDDWEFQETTIIKAQDKLRSTRAKLAVLEGKMALALSEAQKAVEEKQRRIDGAQRALDLLRTVCIIWPSPASKVLLYGSFDGWSCQRKMERSSGGIFSAYLKLYPGRYEIKFVVDGVWKVDPLRPIVHNNGFENNLLIV